MTALIIKVDLSSRIYFVSVAWLLIISIADFDYTDRNFTLKQDKLIAQLTTFYFSPPNCKS